MKGAEALGVRCRRSAFDDQAAERRRNRRRHRAISAQLVVHDFLPPCPELVVNLASLFNSELLTFQSPQLVTQSSNVPYRRLAVCMHSDGSSGSWSQGPSGKRVSP